MENETRPDEGRVRRTGRRFERGGRPWWCRAVCYGPFPDGTGPDGWPSRDAMARDFDRMAQAGFNAVRTFEIPGETLLELAGERGLAVWAGFPWGWQSDFVNRPDILARATTDLAAAAARFRGHRALAGWMVANEIEATLVRWLGREKVSAALEGLCSSVHTGDPEALALYANYPPTEYLRALNADVAGMNVYLEDEATLRRYLRRAHHLAGELPLFITEFGMDRLHHGANVQADWARRAFDIAFEEGAAGLCWFTWTDAWRDARTGGSVQGWKFGLVAENGTEHPALAAVRDAPAIFGVPEMEKFPKVSVLVCTRNGQRTLPACLAAIGELDYPDFETIVVDDGSQDGTGDWVAQNHPGVHLLRSTGVGLSAARNLAAGAATGEILAYLDDDCEPDALWLRHVVKGMCERGFAIAGGPNLAPPKPGALQAVLDRLPGLPVQVMLDDVRAEHLPGCNLLVRKETHESIGGFDGRFHTAGDDVDYCWRAVAAGHASGFVPMAVVWHHRRSTAWKFLKQQIGYGRAEALLADVWKEKVGPGGARWAGAVYGPGLKVARVYRGRFGYGDYLHIEWTFGMPRPPVGAGAWHRWLHRVLCRLQPWARAWGRWKGGMRPPGWPGEGDSANGAKAPGETTMEGAFWHEDGLDRDVLLEAAVGHWRAAGASIVADDGWQDYDLRVTPPPAPGAAPFTLVTVTEYTETKGRLTRWRLRGPGATLNEASGVLASLASGRGFRVVEGG
ncbi:MAG: glycosyltransferase [Verrucomicrobiales bacterium]